MTKRGARQKPVKMLCTYRPKRGRAAIVARLLKRHWTALRKAGLASVRPAIIWRAVGRDGRVYFVEMFEWKDGRAAHEAHLTPAIMAIWQPLGAACAEMDFSEIVPVKR